MSNTKILNLKPLGFPWQTQDPFLFCAYHKDTYPPGNEKMGPDSSLEGRQIGQDFTLKDGWRMYHGDEVPGFPHHPHLGFETVTIVKEGMVDHSDSLGAAGRFGDGDVQWMTAGKGVQHSEMFPLLHKDKENPLLLFQIWLNLPKAHKMVEPHFKMLWSDTIPVLKEKDEEGRAVEVDVVAGNLKGLQAPAPAPDSWAADPENEVAVWTIKMEAHAKWTLPASKTEVNRTLYYYKGDKLNVEDRSLPYLHSMDLRSTEDISLAAGTEDCYILILQGKPIGEPVAQHGPFVMNTMEEIQRAFQEYRSTQFGGWPWDKRDPVHGRDAGRFARYADGTEEYR